MPRKALEELTMAVFKGDIAVLISAVERMDRQGKDMHRLALELMDHCRNLLIYLETGAAGDEMDITEPQLENLKAEAALVDAERLFRIIDVLTETIDRLRFALSKKTLLEVALLRCARAATTVSLDQIAAKLKELSSGMEGRQEEEGRRQKAEGRDQKAEGRRQKAEGRDQKTEVREQSVKDGKAENETEISPDNQARETPPARSVAPATHAGGELELLVRDWRTIVERTGRAAPLAKANLVDARPVAVDAEKVTIAFEPEFAERAEQAGLPRSRAALQKALSVSLRRPVAVDFTVNHTRQPGKNTPEAMPPADNCPEKAAKKNPAEASEKKEDRPSSSPHKWLKDEAVSKILDLFDGRIVEVRE
ncbi:MAG: hypothetical protein PHP98_09145, partial [Kiritimatiellae bacterium]|nr:hypothetical protein [Kiritimatiellia bacterium]